MQYREAGVRLTDLLRPNQRPVRPVTLRITGISGDVYAGWSLLATVSGLPAERTLDFGGPILLEPDGPGRKRMIVVGASEIGAPPHDGTRHFLLKAFAIDADRVGAGLHDAFHLAATTVDDPQVLRTLSNRSLSSIEIARCLAFEYHTGIDPGLCR